MDNDILLTIGSIRNHINELNQALGSAVSILEIEQIIESLEYAKIALKKVCQRMA